MNNNKLLIKTKILIKATLIFLTRYSKILIKTNKLQGVTKHLNNMNNILLDKKK